jgi:hypothetical protein
VNAQDVQPVILAALISAAAVLLANIVGQTVGAIMGTKAAAKINAQAARDVATVTAQAADLRQHRPVERNGVYFSRSHVT